MNPAPSVVLHIGGQNATQAAFDQAERELRDLQATAEAFGRTMQDQAGHLSAVDRAFREASAAASGLTGGVRDLHAAMAGMDTARAVTGFDAMRAAAEATTSAIRAQIVAMGDLRLVDAGGFGGGTPHPTGSVARTAEQDLLHPRGVANLFGLPEGVSGALGGAFFSPGGMAALAAGFGAFKTAQAAADYQSAIAQTTAQYTTSTGQAQADAPLLAQGILGYEQGGHAPYNATTIARSIEPLLAHLQGPDAVQRALQALPSIADVSAQNRAPDLTNTINLVNTIAALEGSGPHATGAQLAGYADMVSRAETLTTIPPGQLTTAVPRLLGSIAGTGVSADEALGLYLKAGTANPSARLDATGLGRLISDITTKPTAGAQVDAEKLGLPIGPGAIEAEGGIYGYLQQLQTLTAGPHQRKLLSGIFTQTNALQSFYDLMQGGGLGQAAGYTDQMAASHGASGTALRSLSQGVDQQGTQLMNRFNGDLIEVGDTLNKTVTPALLDLANKGLTGLEHAIKTVVDLAHGPGKDAKSWADQHVPGGVGTILAAGAGPLGLAAAAAAGIAGHAGGALGTAGSFIDQHTPGTAGAGHYVAGPHGARVWVSSPVGPGGPSVTDPALLPHNYALGDPGGNPYIAGAIGRGAGPDLAQGIAQQVADQVAGLGAGLFHGGGTLGPLQPSAAEIAARQQAALDAMRHGAHDTAAQGAYNDARHALDIAIGSHASPDTIRTDLQKVLTIIPSMGKSPGDTQWLEYSAASQAGKALGSEQRATDKAAQDALVTKDQQATEAARLNYEAAQLQHQAPEKIRKAFREYIDDQRREARDQGLHGTALANFNKSLDNQMLGFDQSAKLQGITYQQQQLQDAVTLAGLRHDPAAQARAEAALQAYDTQHADVLHLSPAQLQIQGLTAAQRQASGHFSTDQNRLALLQAQGGAIPTSFVDQMLRDYAATGADQYQVALEKLHLQGLGPHTPPPQLIRPATAGAGDLIAGYGSTAAREALPERPRAAEQRQIALLEQQNEHLKDALKQARQQLEVEARLLHEAQQQTGYQRATATAMTEQKARGTGVYHAPPAHVPHN